MYKILKILSKSENQVILGLIVWILFNAILFLLLRYDLGSFAPLNFHLAMIMLSVASFFKIYKCDSYYESEMRGKIFMMIISGIALIAQVTLSYWTFNNWSYWIEHNMYFTESIIIKTGVLLPMSHLIAFLSPEFD